MNNDYGYFRGTKSVDGDQIDVFLSDTPTEGNVFVVDQVNPETGEFDEHKVMYGFASAEEASAAYLSNYEQGWKGLGAITEVTKEEFKKWVDSSQRKTKAFAEYKSVNAEGAQSGTFAENQPEPALTDAQKNVIDLIEGKPLEEAKASRETEKKEAKMTKLEKQLRKRAGKWKDLLGDVFTVITSIEDVSAIEDESIRTQALDAINKSKSVEGWYSPSTNEAYIYLPHIKSTEQLDAKIVHEVVSHKGLRGLFKSKEQFDAFLATVWNNVMSAEDKQHYLGYVGTNFPSLLDQQLAAADEYIAFKAESSTSATKAVDENFWTRLADLVKRFINDMAGEDIFTDKSTWLDKVLAESIKNFVDTSNRNTSEGDLKAKGFAANGDEIRMSARYVPSKAQQKAIINDIVSSVGVKRSEAKRWLESETSLAAIILDDVNAPYLDYAADDRYKAIKDNTEYPQGTVDFNNICRKRVAFTNMYQRLQKAFPNIIITADDLAVIRQIMKDRGLTVACGLCYVEDRRQLLGEIAQSFIDQLGENFSSYAEGGKTKEKNAEKFRTLLGDDKKEDLNIYDLITLEGSTKLSQEHPGIYAAFQSFNKARGQQSGNLFEGYAEYKREILDWSQRKVNNVNSLGGLRVFSYSDFEAHHLIDIVQIIQDCARKGVMIQGYTKVPAFARAVANTNLKLNRSLIPLGDTGIVDGKLAYDPVEGIDINDPDFLPDNDNIGNILVGINDEQIRLAMKDPFVHFIIPFHTRQTLEIRKMKKIGAWKNYAAEQDEKLDGKKWKYRVLNIYTEVLDAAEKEGKPIKTEREFTEKFLAVCKERGLTPRFERFLDKNEAGDYIYTPGYSKFLVDFKLFDEKGRILPQKPVVAKFDDEFNRRILEDYVKGEKEKFDGDLDEAYSEIVSALDMDGRQAALRYSMSNDLQDMFVSNAEAALANIPMGKATPQQWLSMLQSKGGLKAGEDKWMGLSDWLKSSDEKTITREELGDFISEHKIRIEEQKYGKRTADQAAFNEFAQIMHGWNSELSSLQDKLFDYSERIVSGDKSKALSVEELQDYRDTLARQQELERENAGGGWNALAFKELVKRHGEDYLNAFRYSAYRGIPYVINEKKAEEFYPESADRQINTVREKYTTYGLENKREVALTVPTIEPWRRGDEIHFGDAGEGRAVVWVRFGETPIFVHNDDLEKARQAAKDFRWKMEEKYGAGWKELDRRISPEDKYQMAQLDAEFNRLREEKGGPRKVLVIDEIQSKRHQDAREYGYKDDPISQEEIEAMAKKRMAAVKALDEAVNTLAEKHDEEPRITWNAIVYPRRSTLSERAIKNYKRQAIEKYGKEAVERIEALEHEDDMLALELRKARTRNDNAVPAAPFEKNWHELAMKRMLRYAAENNYDYVAWTTGAQQADRYDLANEVKSINATKWGGSDQYVSMNGNKAIEIHIKNSGSINFWVNKEGVVTGNILNAEQLINKDLSDIVGKSLASRLLVDEDLTITDSGLRLGGEGMKGFYDDILPRFMNKYGKKWGVSVEDINLSLKDDKGHWGVTMHSVPVTREMKESVMDGQLMFSRSSFETLSLGEQERIMEDNQRFNVQLQEEIANPSTEERNRTFSLGLPSSILRKAGALDPDKRIDYKGVRAREKSGAHNYDLRDLRHIVRLTQAPLAIFNSATNLGEIVVLIDNRDADTGEFYVVPIFKGTLQNGYTYNRMKNAYPKHTENLLHWIKSEYGVYYSPKFEEEFLDKIKEEYLLITSRQTNIDARRQLLSSATNVLHKYYKSKNSSKIRFSKLDEEYLAAVEADDMEKAQQLVNEAAEMALQGSKVRDRNGNLEIQYHGSDRRAFGFTVFNTDPKNQNLGSHFGTALAASVFDPEGDKTYRVYLDIKKPWVPRMEDFWTSEDQVYARAVAELAEEIGTNEALGIKREIVAEYPMAASNEDFLEYFSGNRNDTFTGAETLHPKLRKLLEMGGFDGVKYNNWAEDPGNDSWVALYPNQIKSADPITRDNDGKVIPLSKRFSNKSADIRYSKADQDYLDAVEAGDWTKVREMLDKAAEKAGYTIKAFHGSPSKFTVFKPGYGALENELGNGAYFTNSEELARRYMKPNGDNEWLVDSTMEDLLAKNPNIKAGTAEWDDLYKQAEQIAFKDATLYPVYLKILNPRVLKKEDFKDNGRGDLSFDVKYEERKNGVDGLIDPTFYERHSSWVPKGTIQMVVYEPEQIKSAELVTRDNEGNIIPLSQRFSDESVDIRFSKDDEYLAAVKDEDWRKAQEMVDEAAEAAGYTVKGYHGTTHDFTVFDRSKGNAEGNWGKGFYFTNNKDDASANYGNEDGPDLIAKAERLAEQMEWMDGYEDKDYDERLQAAKEMLTGDNPHVISAALKMTNPVVINRQPFVGMQETYFDYNDGFNYETEEYDGEESGLLVDFINAWNEELEEPEWDGNYGDSFRFPLDDAFDGYAAHQLEAKAREVLDSKGFMNQEGDMASGEFLRAVFERMGFDGIIDTDVNFKFGTQRKYGRAMAGVDEGATHFIVFDSSQVKQADPVTYDDEHNVIPLSKRFDESNKDIRFSKANDSQKIAKKDYVDSAELDKLQFSLSKNNKKAIETWMKKREDLSEGERKSVLEYIDGLKDATLQLVTGKWFAGGVIRLPEDMSKVEQAVEVARKAKVDPLQFKSPMELINAHADIKATEKRINPDEVSTLHLAKDYPEYGIKVYDVDDSDESRKNMREIINTHFGKKSSPWCLLQGDKDGNLTDQSERYWEHYNAYQKKVAFKDGKLLAFCANDSDAITWWDREDAPHSGIPITMKLPGDKLGRVGDYELNMYGKLYGPENIHKGNGKNGLYESWHDNDQLATRCNYVDGVVVGKKEAWYPHGQQRYVQNLGQDGRRDGESVWYYKNGNLEQKGTFKEGVRFGHFEEWFEDGQKEYDQFYNEKGQITGELKEWFESGQLRKVSNFKDGDLDGETLRYYSNGQLMQRIHYKNGEKDGTLEEFFQNGDPYRLESYKEGRPNGEKLLYYPDGTLAERHHFVDGELVGVQEGWNENGTKSYVSHFDEKGKRDGRQEAYNDKGDLHRVDIWEHGGQKEKFNYFTAGPEKGRVSAHTTYIANNVWGTLDIYDEEGNIIKHQVNDLPNFGIRFSKVTDQKIIDKLEAGEKVTGYREVVLREDGSMLSPMAGKLGEVKSKGKNTAETSAFRFHEWEQAEENPDLADDEGKIRLVKPKTRKVKLVDVDRVDYNPYIHLRLNLINRQFKDAWKRPDLVFIESEVPEFEVSAKNKRPYRAKKAKLSVGVHDWNGGPLMLTRWDKPKEQVPWDKVAKEWAADKEFKKLGVHFEIVPPQILTALKDKGIKILPPRDGMGRACNEAYKAWMAGDTAAYEMWRDKGRGPKTDNLRFSQAYHGSGADFDKFDHSFMGTGAGRQAYGWGTYVSTNQSYAKVYSGLDKAVYLGEKPPTYYADELVGSMEMDLAKGTSFEEVKQRILDMLRESEKMNKDGKSGAYWKNVSFSKEITFIESLNESDFNVRKPTNNLYTVEIPDDNGENYLHWDKPITKSQSSKIMDLIRREVPDKDSWGDNFEYELASALGPGTYGNRVFGGMDYFLGNLYDYATDKNPGAERNSKLLNSIGIIGMQVAVDRNNGGRYNGDNYVIFDENNVEITDHLRFSESNKNQQIFISNAAYAVDAIPMEKATPQQWLSMLQSKGGLKAGEDKWLGLSDWLKEQSKRPAISFAEYAHKYDDESKKIAHQIKEGDAKAIATAAEDMARFVKDGDILVPIPSRSGKATTSLELAKAISKQSGKGTVVDALAGAERESIYEAKKAGKALPKPADLGIRLVGEIPEGRVLLIDNVLATGTTMEAALNAIPEANVLVYAKDTNASSDRKSLSKQEVLDFINQNKIQIEEVDYEELEDSPSFEMFENEFLDLAETDPETLWEEADKQVQEFYQEMEEKYGEDFLEQLDDREYHIERMLLDNRERWADGNEDPYDLAFQQMVERYGDDFDLAFTHQGANLIVINDDAAASLMQTHPINSTRLDYTTEKLSRKREIALTVPTIKKWNADDDIHFGDAGDGRAIAWARFGDAQLKMPEEEAKKIKDAQHDFVKEMKKKYGELALKKMDSEERDKLIEHLRASAKIVSRVLFIDEIQSKRHQQGRDRGYISDEETKRINDAEKANKAAANAWDKAKKEMIAKYPAAGIKEYDIDTVVYAKVREAGGSQEDIDKLVALNNAWHDAYKSLWDAEFAASGKAPGAPFEKNWHELTFKRMLRLAAEEGYDYVAWTTGEQQANRYNIGNYVSSITLAEAYDGERSFAFYLGDSDESTEVVTDDEGKVLRADGHLSQAEGRPLSDLVGKEMAVKMMQMEVDDTLEDIDLRVGNKGMSGFYDDMLVRFANKYGKKWGSQVKDDKVSLSDGSLLEAHTMPVTDEMKKSVLEGQLMFSRSDEAVEQARSGGIAAVIGEENVGEFYGDVYRALPTEMRQTIVDSAINSDADIRKATEKYLSEAARKGDDWGLLGMAGQLLGYYSGAPLDPSAARYILWKGGQKADYEDLLGLATDVSMRRAFKVGNYKEPVRMSKGELKDEVNAAKQAADVTVDNAAVEKKAKSITGQALSTARAMARQKRYDQQTVDAVASLAKRLLREQTVDSMNRMEIARLLGLVKASVGKSPKAVKKYSDTVIEVVINHLLKNEKDALAALTSKTGTKTNTTGVEVQGELDVQGQKILKAYKEALSYDVGQPDDDETGNTLYGLLAALESRKESKDDAVRKEAEAEEIGLKLAIDYKEGVKESSDEEAALQRQLKEYAAAYKNGKLSSNQYDAMVEATENAIRENHIDQVEEYRDFRSKMVQILQGSVEAKKSFIERDKERVEQIHHYANSDMQGKSADIDHIPTFADKLANSYIVRFFTAPLATFDQMLRLFGAKNVDGEGYLWNKFMRDWQDAAGNAYVGQRDAKKELDKKVSEVFGKEMKWSDLFDIERGMDGATISWMGADGQMHEHALNQGQLLYIYMVNKMADGRMKLRRMGIMDSDVLDIKRQMDDRFLKLADWLQDEYLVEKRNKYNAVHERLFGASMAAIENYFPLVINKRGLHKNEDIAALDYDALPSTTTGSIIKRRRNDKALDLMNADAFSVVLKHIDDMEQWAAFAEFNKDVNTLLSYKRFRNQVQNMASVYGSGPALWKSFRDVCRIAGNTYTPSVKKESLDAAAVNLAKGVSSAKINFRVYTALKQFLSMPAFLADANILHLAENLAKPKSAWEWAMANLPLFQKRWESRIAGDTRLMTTDMDWQIFRSKVYDKFSKIGMSPNAFVDAVTVAIGSHAMYQTKYDKYIKEGYDEQKADKRAKQDATVLYNETQQSSENAFVSTAQLDRTLFSTAITVFRNSSMGFQRQAHDAIRNLGKMLKKGYKEESVAFMTKQLIRDGLTEEQASKAAESRYGKLFVRNAARVATFAFLVQFAWNLGGSIVYLLFGRDDDEKEEMLKEAFVHALIGGSIEGLAGGNIISEALNMVAKGESLRNYDPSLLPIIGDLKRVYAMMGYDKVAGVNELVNLAVQAGIGVNPQTVTDAVVAVVDACNGDLETSREAMLMLMRILAVPQSQTDKIYIDELGMTAAKAKGLSYTELAERYAHYKVSKGAPLTGWAYSDEQKLKRTKAYRNRFNKLVKERNELKK